MAKKLTTAEKKTLQDYIQTGPKSFKLLYSFSQDGASAEIFHEKCDGQGPTVTVIYNTKGTVYGGYTSKSWSSREDYASDEKAFLFRLRNKEQDAALMMPVQNPNYAIYDSLSCGPTFGSGYDLLTFSDTLTHEETYYRMNQTVSFRGSYNRKGITVDQFTNNISTVIDLEVYRVTDVAAIPTWREGPDWDIKSLEKLKNEIDNYTPLSGLEIQSAKILFLGPIGAGKSSFFNTISSVFRGYVTRQAACGNAQLGITSQFHIYRVRGSILVKALKFRMCDTRGFEENQGIDGAELNYLLDGNLPDGYQFCFSDRKSTDIPGFIANPKLNDKIHCTCFVIDGSIALSEKMIEKIRSLQIALRRKGVPQLILLTKIDKICDHVMQDVSTVFESDVIRDLVGKLADTFGVPGNYMLPVKNYENETEVSTDVSILALYTLQQILRATEDFMFNHLDSLDESNTAVENERLE